MHETPLPDILLLLAAAVVVVTIFKSLKLSPVLGYLVAGALIGPHGFALVQEVDNTKAIAELGVILLLFMIGLELSLTRLRAMRKQVLGVGGLQMLFTTFLVGLCAWLLGVSLENAFFIGAGLALSSTALVLQILHEKRELATQTGRLSLAILILQDLAVLPLLVLVPLLAKDSGSLAEALLTALVQAVAVLAAIVVIGRLALRPIFRFTARLDINELFVATTMLVVLGTSFATNAAGLSLALGAFIAGLLLAETEFQHQIEADVKPYKALFMGLFFMSVGMVIDVVFIIENAVLVLASATALILLKATITYGVLRLFSYTRRTSVHTSLLLAQGGEFGFILFGLAATTGVMEQNLSQFLLLVVALTMALTPLLERFGDMFERAWIKRRRASLEPSANEVLDLESHILLAGYGETGALIAKILTRESIPFIAIDTDPRRVLLGRRNKHPVYFGDATRADVLEAVGGARASAIVTSFLASEKVANSIRQFKAHHPEIPVFARATDRLTKQHLQAVGAAGVTAERHATSMALVAFILESLSWPEDNVAQAMQRERDEPIDPAATSPMPSA